MMPSKERLARTAVGRTARGPDQPFGKQLALHVCVPLGFSDNTASVSEPEACREPRDAESTT